MYVCMQRCALVDATIELIQILLVIAYYKPWNTKLKTKRYIQSDMDMEPKGR